MEAIIQLVLRGSQVTQEAAEEFANMIQTAAMMIPKSGDTRLEVGQITLKGENNSGG